MKRTSWTGLAAAAALVLGFPAAASAHAGPAGGHGFGARTLEMGSALHPLIHAAGGRGNVTGPLYSANWSGYIDGAAVSGTSLQAVGAAFTSVSTTFTVPQLDASSPSNSSNAIWTGIGGVFGTGGIVQAGVLETAQNRKTQTYTPIVEDYPNPIVSLGKSVSPGDAVTVMISDQSGVWMLSMSDSTGGTLNWRIGPTAIYSYYAAGAFVAPDTTTAEWIDEDPFCGGTYCKFATFGPVTFSAVTDTATTNVSRTPLESIIVSRSGQPEVSISPPSIGSASLTTGSYSSFTVTRLASGHGPHA